MKKHYLFAIIAIFAMFCTQTNAQGLEKGYHGSVEAGYSVEVLGATLGFNWFELNTIHGYQVTPNIFVGAGIGVHFFPEVKEGHLSHGYLWERESSVEKLLFADLRWKEIISNN
ncbi:MAG: hypothetical protein K6G08_01285 [Prevotella sp.]|nr:hypothetical protein [Prevotella sp.]